MSELSTTGTQAPSHGHASSTGLDSRKLGMWTFIGSETLFFTALIMTYLIYKPVNAVAENFQDPKKYLGIELTTLLATLLLASSLTMVLSLAAIRRNDLKRFQLWMLSTIGLGLAFLGGQVYEFYHLYNYHDGPSLTLDSSLFGSTFFVLTGFHGTHVAIGVIWLLAVYVRGMRGRYSAENDMDVELAGLYWHFVDLVWVVIFVLIYLI
ncbi:MAG: heme-copper oxidase subunit III [Chloroflexi bacterium AL-W]|nr:heme-copper oxidase subunit III [Chloroflexi bacterium AL-N1]NOK68422.1 heme-copper oxidase subunit III [Chloroflexi bacterium AL-N10]NOK74068.1 heme-copper oxidase subunit III [Chloroflexi bacterium AL-N5]NOK83035.1 heme-copper oxidase subunit III [Chloroflexi bacterium AL-W]NOK90558.1 heme-copper oxidase subunit III [Chloroflexi bacterium AL-N15]